MRIRLVEDDPHIADFVGRRLREAGYAVDAVRDGRRVVPLPYPFQREDAMNAFRTLRLLLLLAGALPLAACAPDPEAPAASGAATPRAARAAETQPSDGGSPYAFDRPVASMPLDDELREISGLTVLEDGRVGAIQDEDGVFYTLDAGTGAIEARAAFGKGADYEGIERVGNRLFVLRSNGDLAELTGWATDSPQLRPYETKLKGKNDTEGLGYDAANGRLLIVTKEDPGEGLDDDLKAVYGFDLSTNRLSDEPVFTFDAKAIEEQLTGKGAFKPSALAVHPGSGEVYILSSTGKAILVLDGGGAVRHLWNLPGAIYEQPEGLAFLPDGDLLIASEGVERPAMLHRIRRSGPP